MLDEKSLRDIAESPNSAWGDARWSMLANYRQQGLTQREAAESLGCSSVTVSRKWSSIRRACLARGLKDPGQWDATRKDLGGGLDLDEVTR